MQNYFTVCCDAQPSSVEEETQLHSWDSIQTEYIVSVYGLCFQCKEWSELYENEDNLDWQDEIEYINNHLEES